MTLIYLYIATFTLYFMILALISTKSIRKIRDKYTPKDSNLCVVVYATGKSNTLENLLKQLKTQNYPKQNYTIYTILDKCENVSEVTLQSDLNVNVVNINNLEPIGKSQAYSIIAERLSEAKNLDAYVFLDAKNYVDADFLMNANYYLTKYSVFNPMVNYLPEENNFTFIQNIKAAFSRYISMFLLSSRARLGFTNILNTDAFIIKKDLLNKIASFDFKDLIAEVEYTLKLANEGVRIGFVNELKVYTSINNFDYRIPSLSQRFNIFTTNIFKGTNFFSKEFLCSLIAPNWLVCVMCYALLLKHTYIFPLWFANYTTILISVILLMIAFSISLLAPQFYIKECAHLFLYPLLSLGRILYNFPPIRGIRNIIKATTRKHLIEKMTTNVIVSDGVNDYQCQLELISDDGLAKVTFINKGKKYTTKNNHLRMIDAVRELTTKLADYGMTLKVCQCCKYFQPIVDGSTNMVKGCCQCQFEGRRTPGDIIPTLIWNTCPNFEEHNVVNLF